MFRQLTRWITAILAGPTLVWSVGRFVSSVDRENLRDTLFDLRLDQIHFLLLATVCLILLFELASSPLRGLRLRQLLDYPTGPASSIPKLLLILHWILSGALVSVAIVVPALDLFGSLPFSLSGDHGPLAAKVALVLLGTMYVTHLLEQQVTDTALISKLIASARVSLLDRAQDHEFMDGMLVGLQPGEEILVTHFEEPRRAMRRDRAFGYYYERRFMERWYATIRAKQLRVTQIVLINSQQDIDDLEKRLELTKHLPTYQLAYILAPPLTVFVEVMVVPNHYVKLGFSDDRSARNMNIFKLLLRSQEALQHFERLHREILIPDAVFVKTFEGVRTDEIASLRAKAKAIAAGDLSTLSLFDFQRYSA